jgi:subtilisin family serine protease
MRKVLSILLGLACLSGAAAQASEAPVARSVIIVAFEDTSSHDEARALIASTGGVMTGFLPEVGVGRVSVPVSAMDRLVRSPHIKSVDPLRTWQLLGTPTNDPLVELQWPLDMIGAFKAWKKEGRADPVSVAVIDTGVDRAHVDLEARVGDGFDFLAVDQDAFDDQGHGTHVAGIIAANVNNREGIAGTSRGAQIIPMKACTSGGSCPVFETYEAVVDATRRGANVINMSLGGAGPCSVIDQTIYDYAHQQGVLVVVSAGNSGQDENPVISPASCNYTLGVGAVNSKGMKAPFSSYGDFVDIAAPGVDVWSTVPPLTALLSPHLGYMPASGTSMASPFVAAAAAVLKGQHPEWGPDEIQQRLLSTAVDAGKRGRDDRYGEGILNLYKAVR